MHHFLDYDDHPFLNGLNGTGLNIPLVTGNYDEKSVIWDYWRDYIGNRNVYDLAELFTKVNNHTDYFPSDDSEGDDKNFSNPWNIPKLQRKDIIIL